MMESEEQNSLQKDRSCHFFFTSTLAIKKTVRDSATIVVNCVTNFWDKAKIPIIRKDTVVSKVEKLYKHYQSIKRGKSRRSALQKQKESEFVAELPNLFDIASIDALAVMENQEDREFLLAQREPGRRGTMGAANHKLAAMQNALKKDCCCKKKGRVGGSKKLEQPPVLLC